MVNRRVVVTGLGAVTPVGNDVNSMWENLIQGHSGIDRVSRINPDDFPAKVAAEIKDFDPTLYMDKRDVRKMDLFTQYAMAAAKMAVEDAGLEITDELAPGPVYGSDPELAE